MAARPTGRLRRRGTSAQRQERIQPDGIRARRIKGPELDRVHRTRRPGDAPDDPTIMGAARREVDHGHLDAIDTDGGATPTGSLLGNERDLSAVRLDDQTLSDGARDESCAGPCRRSMPVCHPGCGPRPGCGGHQVGDEGRSGDAPPRRYIASSISRTDTDADPADRQRQGPTGGRTQVQAGPGTRSRSGLDLVAGDTHVIGGGPSSPWSSRSRQCENQARPGHRR